MNGDNYSGYIILLPEAEEAYASDDGQGFTREGFRGLTTKNLQSVSDSESPTDN
jgi:hypothetical protein